MKTGSACFKHVYSCPRVWAILPQSVALACASALFASTSAWTVSGVRDTGFNQQNQILAAISPNGEVYSVGIPFSSPFGACPGPTLTLGDPSATIFSCITKVDASNHPVFAVHISGASVSALLAESPGAVYVAGGAGRRVRNDAGRLRIQSSRPVCLQAERERWSCSILHTD